MFEIEKRSLIKIEEDFDNVKKYLYENAKFIEKKILKSFLFLKPRHLRIRLVKGKDKAIITEKIGEYTGPARKENEKEIPLNEIPVFLEEIQKKGFEECSEFNNVRDYYKLDGLSVEMNKIDLLGMFVEVEALTENEDKIPEYEEKIINVLNKLNLNEFSPVEYKKLVNTEWKKALKKISEHKFDF